MVSRSCRHVCLTQLLHSVVLLAAPLSKRPGLAGGLLATGSLLFSGSLYAMVLTDQRKLGAITVRFRLRKDCTLMCSSTWQI